jgi:phage baseplate assembly protein W
VVEVLHPNTNTPFVGSGGGGYGGGDAMPASFFVPDVLMKPASQKSKAVYVDVNPVPDPQTPELLYDAAAVFAAIRNLLLCPRGGRSAIFQEDYFCGVYDLLQEPFDMITATQLNIAIHQSLLKWEPRIAVSPSDVTVYPDSATASYIVTIRMTVNNTRVDGVLSLPVASS